MGNINNFVIRIFGKKSVEEQRSDWEEDESKPSGQSRKFQEK